MIKTLGFVTVAGLLVYGQVAPAEMPLSSWSQVSAVGLLMFLLYWIVVKQAPKERQEARDHTERVAEQIGADFKAVQKQQHEDSQATINKLELVAQNCAAHLARNGK